ncbi:MAG: hypothetical protein KAR44_04835 [Candidatus Aegiribacteria sp.]|nr:hypothetical protein [Candidatus Aegiribacteria sp.]
MKKQKKNGFRLPDVLEQKLSVLRAMRRGNTSDDHWKIMTIESELNDSEDSDEHKSITLATAGKIYAESRSHRRAMREEYGKIVRGMASSPLLRPLPPPFPDDEDERWDDEFVERTSAKDLSSLRLRNPIWGCEEPSEPQGFELSFISNSSTSAWNTSDITSYNCGIMGWCDSAVEPPRIANMNGKGVIEGDLDLDWEGMVPEDNIYMMNPTMELWLRGYCFAEGYYKIGVDAKSSVYVETSIMINEDLISYNHVPVVSVESRYSDSHVPFDLRIYLHSDEFPFRASKDQFLRMLIRLHGETWTRGEGDAEISIGAFGVISNTVNDLNIPVMP